MEQSELHIFQTYSSLSLCLKLVRGFRSYELGVQSGRRGEAGHGFGICDSKASLPEEIRIKKNSRGEAGATAGYRLGLMQDLTILICSDSDGFHPH